MTAKADYSTGEWQLLMDMPPAVGTAVMVAANSGLGSVKEAMALAKSTLAANHGFEDNELISSLLEHRLKHGERSSVETLSSPYRGQEPEAICEDVAKKCRQVSKLLAAKSTPSEADEYKRWVLQVGLTVANAAKEGGFLGVGGQRVSDEEQVVLDAVADALEVKLAN